MDDAKVVIEIKDGELSVTGKHAPELITYILYQGLGTMLQSILIPDQELTDVEEEEPEVQ